MTVPPSLARGGVDLDAATRRTFDSDMARDVATRLVAVGPGRTVLVAENLTLASLDTAARTRLWQAETPQQRFARGGLWDLGRVDGTPCCGVVLDSDEAADCGHAAGDTEPAGIGQWPAWLSIRQVCHVPPADSTLASHALALSGWWRTSRFCTRCGGAVAASAGGWEQYCRSCDTIEYPRQDPSIIVAITDADDRLLLAHNTLWRPRSMSVIAGYIEAGEAAERAIAREVAEETGLSVTDVTYVASQAWPFPRSLMLGFRARALSIQLTLADDELDRAVFLSRDEFDRACRDQAINPPAETAIAATLITQWLGHPIIRGAHTLPW